jgi:hypothetical protein
MAKKKPASFAFTAPPKWPEPNTENFAAAEPTYEPDDTGEPEDTDKVTATEAAMARLDSKEACQAAMDKQHKVIADVTERLAQARHDLDKLIGISRRYNK